MEFTGQRALFDGRHLRRELLARHVFAEPLVQGRVVLDAACGTGYGSHYLAAKGAHFVVGVDVSRGAIEYSRSRYQRHNLAFMVGDCLHLPFGQGVFDIIVSFELIEHLRDYDRYLSEVERVLASSGVYIASTRNKRQRSPERDSAYKPFHLERFYPQELDNLLRRHFSGVKILGQRFVQGFLIFHEETESAQPQIARDPPCQKPWDLNEARDLIVVSTKDGSALETLLAPGLAREAMRGPSIFLTPPLANVPTEAVHQLPELQEELLALRQLVEGYQQGRFIRTMAKIHDIRTKWLSPTTIGETEPPVTWNKPVPLPRKLTIEPFGGCNLRCPLCPTGQGRKERPRGPMRMALFREIIRQLGDSTREIDLYNWGEPLLNPTLPEMIRIAADRGIETAVSTNLNYLPEPATLVASGLNKLIVSCNGFTSETYSRYHVGGDFETVMNNLERILKYRDLNPQMEIFWRFITFAHNQHEIPLVIERCQELGIRADICEPRLDMREEILRPVGERMTEYREWIPLDSSVYDLEKSEKKTKWSTCRLPWRESCIDVDGSVMVCCSSYDKKYDLGNILATPFEEIWNGALYRASREYLEVGTVTSGARTLCHICKDNGFRDY
jgi:MoaA/NifB/PqqE/SkfB family radical SAM enzyme/SAM-dependent methyltransferase